MVHLFFALCVSLASVEGHKFVPGLLEYVLVLLNREHDALVVPVREPWRLSRGFRVLQVFEHGWVWVASLVFRAAALVRLTLVRMVLLNIVPPLV